MAVALLAAVAAGAGPEIPIPGSALRIGAPISRVDSLRAPGWPLSGPELDRRRGTLRFFGLEAETQADFADGRLAHVRFVVNGISTHSRDYVEDQLRLMGLRRSCEKFDDTSHDCAWTGRAVLHVTWKPGVLTAEAGAAPILSPPAPPEETAPREAPMLPDTLALAGPHAGGSEIQPVMMDALAPVYPAAARRAGVQGVVRVLATVDTTGRVLSAELLHGVPELNDAALDTVRACRFEPLVVAGRVTRFRIVIRLVFARN